MWNKKRVPFLYDVLLTKSAASEYINVHTHQGFFCCQTQVSKSKHKIRYYFINTTSIYAYEYFNSLSFSHRPFNVHFKNVAKITDVKTRIYNKYMAGFINVHYSYVYGCTLMTYRVFNAVRWTVLY